MTARAALKVLREHKDATVREAGQRLAQELKRGPRPVFVVARRPTGRTTDS